MNRNNNNKYGSRGGEGEAADVRYKVCILGESSVGKTSMLRCLSSKGFTPNSLPTMGIDFVTKTFDVEGAKVQLQIWDTAGQERFRSITRFHYRGTKGIVLVYDITSKETFSMIDYWMNSIDRDLDRNNSEPVPVYLVGNKCDLVKNREVTTVSGQKAADSHYVHGFMETSAKINTNIEAVFSELAHALVEIYDPKLLHSYQTTEEQLRRRLALAERQLHSYQTTEEQLRRRLALAERQVHSASRLYTAPPRGKHGNKQQPHTVVLARPEKEEKCSACSKS